MKTGLRLHVFRIWQKLNRHRLLRRWEDMCANDYEAYIKLLDEGVPNDAD